MKKIIFSLFLLSFFFANGQVLQQNNSYGWQYKSLMIDSAIVGPVRDTLNWYWNSSIPFARRIGTKTTRPQDSLEYRWTGLRWLAVGSGGGGSNTFLNTGNVKFTNTSGTITAELPDSTKLTNTNFTNGRADYTTVNPNVFTFTQQATSIRVSGTSATMGNYMKYTGLTTSSNTWSQVLGFKIQTTTGGLGIGVATPSQDNALAVRATFTSGVASINMLVPATLSGLVASTKTFNVSAGDSLVLFIKRIDRYVFASLFKPSTGEYITAQKYFDLTTEALIHRVATPAIYFTGGTSDIYTHVFSDANSPINFVLLGDSRSEGAYAGSGAAATSYGNNSRYFAILKSQLGNGYNYSIGGNQTTEVLATINQARLHRPHFAFVNIGTNDAIGGTTSAAYNTAIDAITYKLIANGIIPILVTPNPWDISNTAANSKLKAYKDSILAHVDLKTINTYTTMATDSSLATIYNSGDGHENAFGNAVIGNLIVAGMTGFVKTGISGTTILNGGGVGISMVDNGYGFNEINSNALLVFRSTVAVRAFSNDGLQIFNSSGDKWWTSEPELNRTRFTTPVWKTIHSNTSATFTRDLMEIDSFGVFKLNQYASASNGDSIAVFSTDGTLRKRVNPSGGGGVTSVATGYGLTGGTITTTGTIIADTAILVNKAQAQTISGVKTFSSNPVFSTMASGVIPFTTAGGLLSHGGLLYNGAYMAVGGYNAVPARALLQVTGSGTYGESIHASSTIRSATNIITDGYGVFYGNISAGHGFGGASPNAASAILDVTSTTKGALLPRMTRTLANNIVSKVAGLEVYSTTDSCKMIWNGTKFMYLGKSGTYVPTYTSTANIASTVVTEINYEINGDMLTISGEVEFGITTPTTATELRISLPSYVVNNFTATKFGGGITLNDAASNVFTITPVSGTTLIAFKSLSPSLTSSYKYPFTVSFRIL